MVNILLFPKDFALFKLIWLFSQVPLLISFKSQTFQGKNGKLLWTIYIKACNTLKKTLYRGNSISDTVVSSNIFQLIIKEKYRIDDDFIYLLWKFYVLIHCQKQRKKKESEMLCNVSIQTRYTLCRAVRWWCSLKVELDCHSLHGLFHRPPDNSSLFSNLNHLALNQHSDFPLSIKIWHKCKS